MTLEMKIGKGKNTPDIKKFGTVFEHILYDI